MRLVFVSFIFVALVSSFGFLLFLTPEIRSEEPPQISKKLLEEFTSKMEEVAKRPRTDIEPDTVEPPESRSNITVTVTVTASTTLLPDRFSLSQNYPNPFNSTTIIEYDLPLPTHVIVEIYNMLGQKVRTLVDDNRAAGSYRVEWDGNMSSGRTAASGVYLYRIQAGSFVKTKKMLLLK